METMAAPPRMAIRMAITTKVYGRPSAKRTIHMIYSCRVSNKDIESLGQRGEEMAHFAKQNRARGAVCGTKPRSGAD